MYLLKQRFAPTGSNTLDSYIDLIYCPISSENTNKTNYINSNTDSSAENSASTSEKLQVKYEELSYNLYVSPLTQVSINQNKKDNTFANLWTSNQEIIQTEKDEVFQYINFSKVLENNNSLTW
ncbi:22633_t:CDS:2 [Cetraspora pellucida]|uniref:22633_t:CDS:1 n=1 Tax=Cetraspora pellucida TaxID=1433469 RepID=A0A9N9HVZ0_9GLOM|nr:22633_t:CDS:2 [Cetraspora pellucida]